MAEQNKVIDTPLHGIYIPIFFILFGTAFFGLDKLAYGVGLVALLVGFRVVNQKFFTGTKKLKKDTFRPFELIEQTIISKDSAIYRFKLKDEESIEIPLGHHVACKFDIEDEEGETKEVVRYYTPISNKYDKGFFDILVKSYPTGTVSKKFAGLGVHQNVDFKGPVGRFPSEQFLTLDHLEDKTVVLIAGGSGITPFLRLLIESPMKMKFKLVYYSKSEKDVLLKNELDEVNQFKDSLEVVYKVGLLAEANLAPELGPEIDRLSSVLICGPPGFNKEAQSVVEGQGFSEVFVF